MKSKYSMPDKMGNRRHVFGVHPWWTKSLGGKYVIIGVVSMFTLQIFENIDLHIGLMPLTGISLVGT
jgi:hypothetical protein